MPLKKTDDIGDWIKDFYKSKAPQFDGASKEKRRKMAVAAYLSAQEAIQSVFENDEYDAEGKMAKSQLKTLLDAAQQLHDMLADDTNMPEWVQGKITKATDYIDTARDYMQSELEDGKGPVGEDKNQKADGAYMKGVARKDQDDRKAHFKKYGKKDDDKDSSYKPAPGDKDPKTGELKKTKLSKHTKKYRQMYGEDVKTIKVGADALTAEEQPHYALIKNRKVIAVGEKEELLQRCAEEGGRVWLTTCKENELVEELQIDEKIEGLEKKSKKSGISYSILKKVYDRGMAAWKTGHRPGTTPQQWAFARVNSFITKGKGTWGKADKDLAAKVRKEQVSLKKIADDLEEKKKGLWANIHAKRKRGEAPAKPGDKDYPEKLPEESVEESKFGDLTIQFADEMQELVKLIKGRKNQVAANTMAKMVEKGNMKGASAAYQNLDKNARTLVAGAFASLFGDKTAKRYDITEDTEEIQQSYADYISKTLYK